MEMALKSIPNLQFHKAIRHDDKVDQLHNYVTVYLLVLSGLIVGVKELAGEPLDCWVTLEKCSHFQAHANYYCWAQNRLYHFPNPMDKSEVPYPVGFVDQEVKDNAGMLNSYRWVTVVLILQAILFKLPDVLWTECNSYSGTKLEELVSLMKKSAFKPPTERKSDQDIVTDFLEKWLKLNGRSEETDHDPRKREGWCYRGILQNRFLSTMYIVVKFCYLLNLIFQFVIISTIMKFDFWTLGSHLNDGDIKNKYFPLAGLCHLEVRGRSEWVQCILVLNRILEKIFVVEWFWFIILLIITVMNLVLWVLRIFYQGKATEFIKRFLPVLAKNAKSQKNGFGTLRHFVSHYLGQDGVFVMRILSINTSTVATAELMQSLWDRYVKQGHYICQPSVNPEDDAFIEMQDLKLLEKNVEVSTRDPGAITDGQRRASNVKA